MWQLALLHLRVVVPLRSKSSLLVWQPQLLSWLLYLTHVQRVLQLKLVDLLQRLRSIKMLQQLQLVDLLQELQLVCPLLMCRHLQHQ